MQPKQPNTAAQVPPSVQEQIDAFWKQASFSNPALNPKISFALKVPDLSVDLMETPEVLLMQHKIRNPKWMDDAVRWQLIQRELAEQAQGGPG